MHLTLRNNYPTNAGCKTTGKAIAGQQKRERADQSAHEPKMLCWCKNWNLEAEMLLFGHAK